MYNPLPANNGGAGETLTVSVCMDSTRTAHAACSHAAARPALLPSRVLLSAHSSRIPTHPCHLVVCCTLFLPPQVYDVDVEFVMLDGQIVAQDIDGDADDK